jgi:4-aminobutyrate aminotransferase-like enzyme
MPEGAQSSITPDESTARVLQDLRDYESPNVTYQAADGSWPIVWASAQGMQVTDLAGREYLDLTAAFGVAAAGHANRRVVQAATRQMRRLLHAMGDVHPHPLKAELARVLSRITFERWTAHSATGMVRGRTVFGNSGFEAVEAALKTAMLATGRRGVMAFERGYHGLGYGALELAGRDLFRLPFLPQLGGFAAFVPYPDSPALRDRVLEQVNERLGRGDVGAVVVEPIQGRGGIRVPAPGFLRGLRSVCDAQGGLLIADEIYTGFGRTGHWFGCEDEAVVPDLVCLGKALTGGFPLSACVGRAELMERAWPASTGEALHTSTFLGHPVGCAMALAQIAEIDRLELVRQSAVRGRELRDLLDALGSANSRLRLAVRGRGLMVGIEMSTLDGRPATREVWELVRGMLQRGFLVLPEGEQGEVLALTPPLIVRRSQLSAAVEALGKVLGEL